MKEDKTKDLKQNSVGSIPEVENIQHLSLLQIIESRYGISHPSLKLLDEYIEQKS